jgi:acetyl-CoA acetyltransferase
MFACELADYFQLKLKSLNLVECGGNTSTAAIHYAIDEIQTKRNRINAVIAIDVRFDPTDDPEFMLPHSIYLLSSVYGVHTSQYGIGTPLPLYALGAQRYMYETGITEEDAAHLSVVLRENASKNPLALFREPITVEDVMKSKCISPPLKLLDCSTFATAAGACIMADYNIKSIKPKVNIIGLGEFHHNSSFIPLNESITSFVSVREAGKEAFSIAGINPTDIDVAEVYGVFSFTELMLYEDLGFFGRGEAVRAVKEGLTRINGRIPINPSGGRLSLGHPASATPMLELVEVVRQLRHECGERQVKEPEYGLVHAEHGMLNGSTVLILERE